MRGDMNPMFRHVSACDLLGHLLTIAERRLRPEWNCDDYWEVRGRLEELEMRSNTPGCDLWDFKHHLEGIDLAIKCLEEGQTSRALKILRRVAKDWREENEEC
jgi:hypothetical protein